MCRDEGVHESLEIRAPPLRKSICNFPISIHAISRKLLSARRETFVQSRLEAFDLVVIVMKVVARSAKA